MHNAAGWAPVEPSGRAMDELWLSSGVAHCLLLAACWRAASLFPSVLCNARRNNAII